MIKKLLLLLVVMAGFSCSTKSLQVTVDNITISQDGQSITVHKISSPSAVYQAAIILAGQGYDAWQPFCEKVAQTCCDVYFVSASDADSVGKTAELFQTIKTVVADSFDVRRDKIVLMGNGPICMGAIKSAATDSVKNTVITMTPQWPDSSILIDSWLKNIQPGQFVLITSGKDAAVAKKNNDPFFNMASDPKRVVWLDTDDNGVQLIQSDMEPIVRRIVFMAIERMMR